jgi:hypothetical protein
MELIDRYLHAVEFWLPKKQKKDILAELEGDVKSEIEDREARLGRGLTEAEVGEILKRRGSPLFVANSFKPQRSLIGPVLFPIYTFVLKMVFFFYLIPWAAVWTFMALFVPSFRAAHPGPQLFGTLGSLWQIALAAFAMVTIGFAVAEGYGLPDRMSGKWTPNKLPKIRDVQRIPRSNSIADVVFGLVFLGWWVGILTLPSIHDKDGSHLTLLPGSLWPTFRHGYLIPIAILIAVGIGMGAVNLVRPVWTRLRLGIRAAADAAMAVIAALVLLPRWQGILDKFNVLRHTHPAGLETEIWTAAIDFAVMVSLLVVGLSCLASCIVRIRQIIRWKRA